MAFLATENGALIVARIAYGSEHFSNHIWASMTGFDDTDLQNLVNNVKAAYISVLLDDFTVSNVFMPFKGYDMRTIDGTVLEDSTGGVSCTGGSKENPPNVACVLTLYTAKRGRAHRGRLFIGPMKEENIADGVWSESAVDEMIDLGDALAAGIANAGFEWGVRSGQLDGVPRDPAIITPITSYVVRSNRVGTQRRRVDRI